MVADELALSLAAEYVSAGDVLLDPFCGSGRLLAAANSVAGTKIGFDVNPLACLLSRAKFAAASSDVLRRVHAICSRPDRAPAVPMIKLPAHRHVDWFSSDALTDLSNLVAWVNSLTLDYEEALIVAATLSAVTRDVSFARKSGWKLHRMNEAARASTRRPDAWTMMRRRLLYCILEIEREPVTCGPAIVCNESTTSSSLGERYAGIADVVLTSPPYGDSKSTVQYGAASELCLNVVRNLDLFSNYYMRGGDVDRDCLGGNTADLPDVRLQMFWAGKRESAEARAAGRFLAALSQACSTIDTVLKPGGVVIFVVGRRSTGGFRLKMDEFLCDEMGRMGMGLENLRHRALKEKRAPSYVNRFARSASPERRASGVLPTMKDEIILTFRKTASDGEGIKTTAAKELNLSVFADG